MKFKRHFHMNLTGYVAKTSWLDASSRWQADTSWDSLVALRLPLAARNPWVSEKRALCCYVLQLCIPRSPWGRGGNVLGALERPWVRSPLPLLLLSCPSAPRSAFVLQRSSVALPALDLPFPQVHPPADSADASWKSHTVRSNIREFFRVRISLPEKYIWLNTFKSFPTSDSIIGHVQLSGWPCAWQADGLCGSLIQISLLR